MVSNILTNTYNIMSNGFNVSDEEIFDAVMNKKITINGRRSVFSMIKDENLSIFIIGRYVKLAKERIEKNWGAELDENALKYLNHFAVFVYIFNAMKNIVSFEKEDEENVILPVKSVVKVNTDGLSIADRSTFDADVDKSGANQVLLRENALIRKDKHMSLLFDAIRVNSLTNSGKSVSIRIHVNFAAVIAAMKIVLFIREVIYSERLII